MVTFSSAADLHWRAIHTLAKEADKLILVAYGFFCMNIQGKDSEQWSRSLPKFPQSILSWTRHSTQLSSSPYKGSLGLCLKQIQ